MTAASLTYQSADQAAPLAIAAWRLSATWTKVKADDPTTPSMKTGYYFRGATEHAIFCVRGSLKIQTTRGVSTAFLHPRTPHSVKPDAFYALVEECSPGPYLELFARRPRTGWSVWGNEVPCDVDLAASG